jgi:DNA-binding MarR family transcriptional regulator
MPARFRPASRSFGFLLNEVSRLLRREFDRRIQGCGLTRAQWLTLYHLARQPGCLQRELADSLQQAEITVGRQVARLIRSGLVSRRADPADARAWRLALTARGQRQLRALAPAASQLRRDAFRGIAAPRQRALLEDLQHIRTNLSPS